MREGVVVSRRDKHTARPRANRVKAHFGLIAQRELVERRQRQVELSLIDALGDGENCEEHNRECAAGDRRHFLCNQVDSCNGEQHHRYQT